MFGLGGGLSGFAISGARPPLYDWGSSAQVFDTAGAYGNLGPSASQLNTEYSSRSFYSYSYRSDKGILFIQIPDTKTFNFDMRGACGGRGDSGSGQDASTAGGKPRRLQGSIQLYHSEWIGIIIGQKGGQSNITSSSGGGGGGGTFVFLLNSFEDTLTETIVENTSITPLLVASGGNGSNWDSWNVDSVNGRGIDNTVTSDWIEAGANSGNDYGNSIYGRGAFGGSFNYTDHYETDNTNVVRYNSYSSTLLFRSGYPLLDSNNRIFGYSLRGGMNFSRSSPSYSRSRNVGIEDNGSIISNGGDGGFGGGAGSRYEGGGGGGYWGGAPSKTNDYNTDYDYGAYSYADSSRVTITSDAVDTRQSVSLRNTSYTSDSSAPDDLLQGRLELTIT